MTDLELIDFVSSKIIEQGRLAKDKNGKCRYRLHEGDKVYKCAAGHLIPDSKYTVELEGLGCYGLKSDSSINIVQEILIEEGYNPYIVSKLQILHDNSKNIEEFVLCMENVKRKIQEGTTLSKIHAYGILDEVSETQKLFHI